MKKKDTEWLYEKLAMEKKYLGVKKKRIPIRDVPDHVSQVAYTTPPPDRAIYIRKDSRFTKGLDDHKARAFRFGLFTKEMARLEFTNFDYQNKIAETLEPYERNVFRLICSIIEEPAVESLAPTFIGGFLLQSLRYATKRVYDCAEPIDSGDSPFEEFILALQQFGDMGPLKGSFKTPAARTIFYRCVPTASEAIEEIDAKKRTDMALKVHNISKPLWEAEAKSTYIGEETLSSFEKMLSILGMSVGKSSMLGGGSGSKIDPEELEEEADFTKGASRKTTIKEIKELSKEEKEAYERAKEDEEAEEETIISEEEEMESGNLSADGNDEDFIVYDETEKIDLSTVNDYDPIEDEIDVSGCDFFDKLVRTELEISEIEEKAAAETSLEKPFEFPSVTTKYESRNYKCANLTTTLTNRETAVLGYNKIVGEYEDLINNCYKKLKALFAEDAEETVYKSSGKLSLKKTVSGTVTSKVFTKKVDPKNKSNMAVMLVIDESGSMSGTRIQRAKTAAINLAEIFKKLGIPLYVMGFTADTYIKKSSGSTERADAVHHHYSMWSSASNDLLKLTSIHAEANNFDGYSIRYASKVLEKRPETHKVMIVISDGQPACNAYSSISGYSDTKDAIREARGKSQNVLGVAIGADLERLHDMYGNDFVFIKSSEDLFTGIVSKFTNMVKKW
ncbi:cobaltochelatase CobT-related protein [Hungatella hathewayi]|uniref:cobaltochelatase CobT-related protein n=1 Tax=Hungatella hathewayi TaxID=154046 RepID=UPI0035659793